MSDVRLGRASASERSIRTKAECLYSYLLLNWIYLQPFLRDQVGENVHISELNSILVEMGRIAGEKMSVR